MIHEINSHELVPMLRVGTHCRDALRRWIELPHDVMTPCPVVSASLRPPATVCDPFRVKTSPKPETNHER